MTSSQAPTGFKKLSATGQIIRVVEVGMEIVGAGPAREALARGVAMTIMRFETDLSLREIGDIFGLHFATVFKATNQVLARMRADAGFNTTVERLILQSRLAASLEVAREGLVTSPGTIFEAAPVRALVEAQKPIIAVLPSPPSPVPREAYMEAKFKQWAEDRKNA